MWAQLRSRSSTSAESFQQLGDIGARGAAPLCSFPLPGRWRHGAALAVASERKPKAVSLGSRLPVVVRERGALRGRGRCLGPSLPWPRRRLHGLSPPRATPTSLFSQILRCRFFVAQKGPRGCSLLAPGVSCLRFAARGENRTGIGDQQCASFFADVGGPDDNGLSLDNGGQLLEGYPVVDGGTHADSVVGQTSEAPWF